MPRLMPNAFILFVLTGALLSGAVEANATPDDTPVTPNPSRTQPPVIALPTREGLEASAEDRMLRRKQSRGRQKPSGKSTGKASNEGRQTGDRQPRDDPPLTVEDEIHLNIGICGRMQQDGTVPGPDRCQPVIPDDPRSTQRQVTRVVRPRPQDVTWEQVFSETKDVIFPGLTVHVQPKGRTLVNLDTIVYTDKQGPLTTTITLLGFPVEVTAVPMKYRWDFGDGSPALETSTPGSPYPSKEIAHKYVERGSVGLTVTTIYAASFTVTGLPPQYVGDIPITGPVTPLQVREAVPVLVDPDR
jgi:hypothetical protein